MQSGAADGRTPQPGEGERDCELIKKKGMDAGEELGRDR